MPGLDLSQVSGNWKKLQEQLKPKAQAPASKSLKRKRQDEDDRTANGSKRTRSSIVKKEQQPPRRRSMGSSWSTPKDATATPDLKLATLAKDHGISKQDITQAYGSSTKNAAPSTFIDDINGGLHSTHKIGKYIAIDCEMVGTGAPPHDDNVLARASLVNFHGEQIYDSYVLPPPGVKIEDYRTFVSGIRPADLRPGYARPLKQVQQDVATLLDGRILVGHALRNDLNVLLFSHPRRDIRDTSRYPPFRALNGGRAPALRHLAKVKLGMQIQAGEHSSVEDARATMMLFRMEKTGFEEENRKRFGANPKIGSVRGGNAKATEVGQEVLNEEDSEAFEELDGEEHDGVDEAVGSADKPTKGAAKKRTTKKKKSRTKRK